jgi:hypothetical protein
MKKKTTLFDRLKPELKEALINHTEYKAMRDEIIKSLKDKRFVNDITISNSVSLGICTEKPLLRIVDIHDCFISVVDTTLIDVDHDGIPTNVTDEDVEKYNHQSIQSDIKKMAIKLSERHGIKLSRSDEFNKLTPQLQGKVRKEVYKNLVNAYII